MKHLYLKTMDELKQNFDIVYILDLDSTLFDLCDRQIQIFREFAKEQTFIKKYPKETQALQNLDREHLSFYPEDCIKNYGLSEVSKDFSSDFYPFWSERFFSDEYCKYDLPELGSQAFVESLYKNGAHIHYLTGRDVARMGKGTIDSLKQHGFFPGGGDECEKVKLILKPDKKMDDAQFKKDYILSIAKDYHRLVFIDNEPKNLAILIDALENLDLVHFDSHHMGGTEVPKEAESIKEFLSLLSK